MRTLQSKISSLPACRRNKIDNRLRELIADKMTIRELPVIGKVTRRIRRNMPSV